MQGNVFLILVMFLAIFSTKVEGHPGQDLESVTVTVSELMEDPWSKNSNKPLEKLNALSSSSHSFSIPWNKDAKPFYLAHLKQYILEYLKIPYEFQLMVFFSTNQISPIFFPRKDWTHTLSNERIKPLLDKGKFTIRVIDLRKPLWDKYTFKGVFKFGGSIEHTLPVWRGETIDDVRMRLRYLYWLKPCASEQHRNERDKIIKEGLFLGDNKSYGEHQVEGGISSEEFVKEECPFLDFPIQHKLLDSCKKHNFLWLEIVVNVPSRKQVKMVDIEGGVEQTLEDLKVRLSMITGIGVHQQQLIFKHSISDKSNIISTVFDGEKVKYFERFLYLSKEQTHYLLKIEVIDLSQPPFFGAPDSSSVAVTIPTLSDKVQLPVWRGYLATLPEAARKNLEDDDSESVIDDVEELRIRLRQYLKYEKHGLKLTDTEIEQALSSPLVDSNGKELTEDTPLANQNGITHPDLRLLSAPKSSPLNASSATVAISDQAETENPDRSSGKKSAFSSQLFSNPLILGAAGMTALLPLTYVVRNTTLVKRIEYRLFGLTKRLFNYEVKNLRSLKEVGKDPQGSKRLLESILSMYAEKDQNKIKRAAGF